MAIPSDSHVLDAPIIASGHEGRKHLQRLVRKVKHVLIVKHCLDDLRRSAALRQSRDGLSETSVDTLIGLPSGSTNLPVLGSYLEHAASEICSEVAQANLGSRVDDEPSESVWKQPLKALGFSGGLNAFESGLDTFISQTYAFTRKWKQNISNPSREIWISWAKKRASSVYDSRALSVLVKLLQKDDQEGEQLHNLQGYVEAYFAGCFGRAPERLSEVVSRLRAVFGVGWFFEWPSGLHPLNSTWPWADVKPSLLVLWGVCWMFMYPPRRPPQHLHPSPVPPFSFARQLFVQNRGTSTPPGYQIQQPLRLLESQSDRTLLPAHNQVATLNGPMRSRHSESPCTARPIGSAHTGAMESFSPHNGGTSLIRSTHPQAVQPFEYPHYYQVEDCKKHIRNQGPNANYTSFVNDARPEGQCKRVVAEHDSCFPEESEPDWLGENPFNFQAATFTDTNTIHHRPSPHFQTTTLYPALMPSQTTFSYPPLDNMDQMHSSQPYMVDQERAFNQMPEPHEYEQHQDPPRYPTPPLPPSDNPYNAQPGGEEVAEGRMDLPMEPKSESDAPSPGRSKPIPKPDREVTKDANGRFYCNWPGCTEEVKDFGRKCEWSKHMDKHDRPYKCPAEGCEKLPGFTYSGGLLRHEREVHNKHGGPRKQLNCPHLNCKRHTGKGFSRQENLNEHLRRVHTDTGLPTNGEDTEDDGNEEQAGGKRKRIRGDSADIREEMKRLKQENEELRRQTEAQNVQVAEMMRQIMQLQQAQQLQSAMQHPRLQAPPAQMT